MHICLQFRILLELRFLYKSRGNCFLQCALLGITPAFGVSLIALIELSLTLVICKCLLRSKWRRILLLFCLPLASRIIIRGFKVRNGARIVVLIFVFLLVEVVTWVLVAEIPLSVSESSVAWFYVELTSGMLVPSVTKVFPLVLGSILTIKRLPSSIIPAGTAGRVNLIKVSKPRPVLFSWLLIDSSESFQA